ncbi:hypothetical protein G7048_02860 [Diaphorobacter sp. HDW4B]|uniref:hypothetical protein n=1 Tax=Diaphorobacter sp. HDW4B TaxID=2714925 RepID=UPI0014085686|nr:hypothetical protein [Diaphorobacter sp. HDW4B]QIL69412.1 hypothetical protein G7048_02860 [Diaphorobacter sp. HDW4B]
MRIFKPMPRLQAVLAIIGSLIIAHKVLVWIVDRNITNGMDATEADVLVFAFVHSVFIFLFAVTGALLPCRGLILRVLGCTLLGLAGLYALVLAASWLYPNYYVAAAAFFLVPIACAYSLWRRLPGSEGSG